MILATTKGILLLNKNSFAYRLIGEAQGLPNQNVYCILPDKTEHEFYWCSSNRGIFKYNVGTDKFFTVGLNDGLRALEFNTASFASRLNGEYVFGSVDGMATLNLKKILRISETTDLIFFQPQVS